MAYTPTEWQTGDVIDAEKLNHAEAGIAAAGQVVILHVDPETLALDKTWQEIHDGIQSGVNFVLPFEYQLQEDETYSALFLVTGAGVYNNSMFYVDANFNAQGHLALSSAADDYPIVNED